MKKIMSVITLILLLFLSGCVSEEDYNALEEKHLELEARLVIIEEELELLENYDDTVVEARLTIIEGALELVEKIEVILEYEHFDSIDDYSNIQTQEEDQYIVYFYTETCSHCITIKTQVLEFAYNNEAGIKVYMMDAATTIGTNYIAGLIGTPSMIIVVDGVIVDLVAGSVSVPELLEAINNGTYSNIN